MNLHRIIYKSHATVLVDLQVVLDIARESAERNTRLGITGILLATNTHFFQALEGEERRLTRVYARIAKDPRHTDLRVISLGPVAVRQFTGWGLKGVGLMGLKDELAERLRVRYGGEGQELRFPEDEPAALAFLDEVRNDLETRDA
jgi:hypothetical protein